MTFSVNDNDRLWREDQKRGWFRFPSPLRYVLLLALLIALIVGVWYILPSSPPSLNRAELPLIRAEEAPFKIKAEDQSIPGISHQDKLIYGRIRSNENGAPVEHILPDPEPPLAHLKDSKAAIQMVNQYMPEDLELEKPIEKPVEKEGDKFIGKTEPSPVAPSVVSIEALIEETLPSQEKSPPEKPLLAKKGAILIQVGSLKSYDLAEEEWTRLSKKYKTVLEGRDPLIQKVDLGVEKGTYYRLRTSFKDEEKAKKACTILKEEKVECRVIQ